MHGCRKHDVVDMYSRSKSCTAVGLRESTFNRQLSHHLSHQTTALNSMVSKAAIGSGSGSGHVSSSGVQGSNQGKARGRKVWGFSEEGVSLMVAFHSHPLLTSPLFPKAPALKARGPSHLKQRRWTSSCPSVRVYGL